jgi:hypothetical protein
LKVGREEESGDRQGALKRAAAVNEVGLPADEKDEIHLDRLIGGDGGADRQAADEEGGGLAAAYGDQSRADLSWLGVAGRRGRSVPLTSISGILRQRRRAG